MRFFETFIEFVLAAAKWLALPIVVLLFLQWPLRSIIGLYSREANDLGQWLFALWSIIVLVTSWSIVRDSARLLERFPDTGNPGYFIIKLALLLMALLVLIEGLLELMPPVRRPSSQ